MGITGGVVCEFAPEEYFVVIPFYYFDLTLITCSTFLAMPSFQQKFFPDIYEQSKNEVTTNAYCSYDSHLLSLFTSSFFLAGMVSSILAAWLTDKHGRKGSMFLGATLYLVGSSITVMSVDTPMLICGRLILVLGCGFINQSGESTLLSFSDIILTIMMVFIILTHPVLFSSPNISERDSSTKITWCAADLFPDLCQYWNTSRRHHQLLHEST